MPGTQQPEVAAGYAIHPHSHIKLPIMCSERPKSLDLVAARPPGVFLHSSGRPHKKDKRVHWHSNVVENEHKMKSRLKAQEAPTRILTHPAPTNTKRSVGSSTQRPAARPTQMRTKMRNQERTTATQNLPRVPDPPNRQQQPPPTPRPTRLKTPDLPDLGESNFCFCHWNSNHHTCATSRPVHQKMDDQSNATHNE